MSLQISRILHAGYIFEYAGTRIAFDPIFENPFSRNCHAFPNIEFDVEKIKAQKLDAVFISHFHDDHCSLESLNLLKRDTPIYMYCQFEELFSWIRELGFSNVHSIEIGKTISIGSIEVTPHRALDADVDSIFQIRAGSVNVLNVVDSWIDDTTLAKLSGISPWDMVLWPFQTMRELEVLAPSRAKPAPAELPEEWIEQLKILKPRFLIPSSCQFRMEEWSWYNHAFFPISYVEFKTQMTETLPGCQIVRLDPGVSVTLSKNSLEASAAIPWIRPIGDQSVDYEYKKDLKPPSTAEISQKLTALTSAQAERVSRYCRQELPKKFESMDQLPDPYFQKKRLWQLSVYDHRGYAENFLYSIEGNRIESVSASKEDLAWLTEVPAAKLFAALESGEALTSMYMRINDRIFSDSIEKEIQDADIMEDPLIHCLFTGAFGSYQKAQLDLIKARSNSSDRIS